MSKKKKFKKFSKAQILEEIKKSAESPKDKIVLEQVKPKESLSDHNDQIQKITSDSNESNYVKSDLKKLAIVFGFVMILLIAVVAIDKKTELLIDFTDRLTNTLNINQ